MEKCYMSGCGSVRNYRLENSPECDHLDLVPLQSLPQLLAWVKSEYVRLLLVLLT